MNMAQHQRRTWHQRIPAFQNTENRTSDKQGTFPFLKTTRCDPFPSLSPGSRISTDAPLLSNDGVHVQQAPRLRRSPQPRRETTSSEAPENPPTFSNPTCPTTSTFNAHHGDHDLRIYLCILPITTYTCAVPIERSRGGTSQRELRDSLRQRGAVLPASQRKRTSRNWIEEGSERKW